MIDQYDPSLSIVGTGQPLVLVPGMDGTGLLFYRQVPLLTRSYRVATYALRDTAATMDVLVSDLARIIESVAPTERRAIIIGESFGGALALSFALARPEQVSRLVILNSFPHFTPQLRLRLAAVGLSALPWGAMGIVRRLTASRLHSPHTHQPEIKRFMELTGRASRTGYINRLKVLRQVRRAAPVARAPSADALPRSGPRSPGAVCRTGAIHGEPGPGLNTPSTERPRAHLPYRARC